jgi:hypothetical protein
MLVLYYIPSFGKNDAQIRPGSAADLHRQMPIRTEIPEGRRMVSPFL